MGTIVKVVPLLKKVAMSKLGTLLKERGISS